MKTAASISPGRGRGIAPFPGPHPQKQNQAVYTKVLTHPDDVLQNPEAWLLTTARHSLLCVISK
jgi:hypothetical protein